MVEILSTFKNFFISFRYIYWSIFFLVSFLVLSFFTDPHWTTTYIDLLPSYLLRLISFLNDLSINILLPLGSIAISVSLLISTLYEYLEKHRPTIILTIKRFLSLRAKSPSLYYYLSGYYHFGINLCFIFTFFTLLSIAVNPENLSMCYVNYNCAEIIPTAYYIYRMLVLFLSTLYSCYFVLIKTQKSNYEKYSSSSEQH